MRKDRAPFGLFPKKLACGSVIYYYSVYDSEGHRRQYSTGKVDLREAEREVLRRLVEGKLLPTDPCTFRRWTEAWFDYERCPYLAGRLERGFSYSKVHAKNRRAILVKYLWPAFDGQTLQSIRPGDIEREIRKLGVRGMSRDLQNRCLQTLGLILDEALRLELITSNPVRKVLRFAHTSKVKGILTNEESARVFDPLLVSLVWRNRTIAYWALRVSLHGGLRLGELLGLQVDDICKDGIEVRHGWDRIGGLKCTKTGRTRFVPLPDDVTKQLLAFQSQGHVFSLTGGRTPVSSTYIRTAFVEALERSGISREQQVSRNLGTHSLRHGLVSRLMAEGTPVAAIAHLVGHQTLTLTAGRYHHQTSLHIHEIRKRIS